MPTAMGGDIRSKSSMTNAARFFRTPAVALLLFGTHGCGLRGHLIAQFPDGFRPMRDRRFENAFAVAKRASGSFESARSTTRTRSRSKPDKSRRAGWVVASSPPRGSRSRSCRRTGGDRQARSKADARGERPCARRRTHRALARAPYAGVPIATPTPRAGRLLSASSRRASRVEHLHELVRKRRRAHEKCSPASRHGERRARHAPHRAPRTPSSSKRRARARLPFFTARLASDFPRSISITMIGSSPETEIEPARCSGTRGPPRPALLV